ncbi:unnamed protein product [Dovyalis caffra]|uniref:Uncharacterized protein n=1 Tax=Dovyalis caffra TaxID=77055 RepID=A0AAV1SAG6_9ROSI|nr:unnamed protein product [Dovyalis caffra]
MANLLDNLGAARSTYQTGNARRARLPNHFAYMAEHGRNYCAQGRTHLLWATYAYAAALQFLKSNHTHLNESEIGSKYNTNLIDEEIKES